MESQPEDENEQSKSQKTQKTRKIRGCDFSHFEIGNSTVNMETG